MPETSQKTKIFADVSGTTYRFLQEHQIAMIDEALCSLGDFGEVRLIVEKGRLRFLVTQKSFDALKWQPGSLAGFPENTGGQGED
jgi:hypothetical protein